MKSPNVKFSLNLAHVFDLIIWNVFNGTWNASMQFHKNFRRCLRCHACFFLNGHVVDHVDCLKIHRRAIFLTYVRHGKLRGGYHVLMWALRVVTQCMKILFIDLSVSRILIKLMIWAAPWRDTRARILNAILSIMAPCACRKFGRGLSNGWWWWMAITATY